uniref:Uncharacterized protein n=1 Tax=Arundo donax TaxID=35708 RepID=A0A0A9CE29_ARUDO
MMIMGQPHHGKPERDEENADLATKM